MATTLIPLKIINTAGYKTFVINGLKSAQSFEKIALQFTKAPGIPNIPVLIKKELQKHSDKLLVTAKITLTLLIIKGLSEQLQKLSLEKVITELNKLITKVNSIVEKIEAALEILKAIFTPIFIYIGVLTALYIISKVITQIPSFGGGWGLVVVVTAIGNAAGSVEKICEKLLGEIKSVPPAILSSMMALLGLIAFANTLLQQLQSFLSLQMGVLNKFRKDSSMTAADWDNVTLDTEVNDKSNKEINLDSGVSLSDNLTARMGVTNQIEKIEAQLSGIGLEVSEIGDCLLPDGTIIQTTPQDCTTQGGTFGYGSPPDNPPSPPASPYSDGDGNVWCWKEPPGEWNLCGGPNFQGLSDIDKNNLNTFKFELEKELNNLGGRVLESELDDLDDDLKDEIGSLFDALNERIITSLLNPHPSVTVEDITKNTGTQYGFYQQEINEKE